MDPLTLGIILLYWSCTISVHRPHLYLALDRYHILAAHYPKKTLIRHTQPNPEPAAASLTAKGKERARLPAVKTEPADDHGLLPATSMRPRLANAEGSAAAMQQVAVPMPVSDCAPFVNLATRAEHSYVGPRAASIIYLASRHPDNADSTDSSDNEPAASKQPRLVSPTPSPVVPPPNYLSLTPSEIDRLLHDSRPFQYRFVYTPGHIRGLAYDVLAELISFMLFSEPASAQEASARVYLYRAIQSHFNRRL
ncbi:hypothetical protein PCANC_12395 [Puccinia coronata f. sp. avenae]|uniref:Uncharacterized protein n=1 Tax=Puccinia coronata f. sp. avenae TaxID=200324 RepID=A0A2N5UTT4_9BASI|nr:hypothetical protein PCANC_12395 [Puccinia coronata f. sp. avenae]